MTVLLLLFQFVFLLFLFLLWLLWLELLNLCWIIVARVDILVLFLILEEMLSVFHNWEWRLLWVYHIWPLLCWGRFPLCSLSGEFYHKWVLNFVKSFSASIEMIIWFSYFNLLIWCITLIDLHMLENPDIPGINPTWSWCMILLMCCWISLLVFCWGFLHLCSSVILACKFIFLWCLSFLYSGWRWLCRMSLGVFLSLQIFGRVWEG